MQVRIFYSFIDSETGIYWMIPFSSQIGKFKDVYSKKVKKYGFCDTIVFGSVLGHKKAFLIQNMCPVLPVYISNEYVDKNSNLPVHIEEHIEDILTRKAKKVLQLQRKGKKLIFPDVLAIEHVLLELMVVEQVAATSDQESKG